MADGHFIPEHVRCLHCMAREQVMPPEAQIRVLVHEDWVAEVGAFEPRPMTQDQAVAAEMLTTALNRFIGVYGVDIAAPRIASTLGVLRLQAKRQMITNRIIAARAPINRRARAAWERGDTDAMRAIEAEPTPDYPGKALDDAWLGEAQPRAKQLQEVRG
jgi:hypothetical protein